MVSRQQQVPAFEAAHARRGSESGVLLSIVIVNWNTRDLLGDCLASIFDSGVAGEVIVVDNASGDNSAGMVRDRFPDVILIENFENRGFAHANNLGIRQSRGAFILLLNADTVVTGDALAVLPAYLRTHPEVGAVGPYIANPDGTLQVSCYPTPTLFREFWRLFHLDRLRPIGVYAMHEWDRSVPREVEMLLGACVLLRREALEVVGLLRETYFMYSEDLDICHRLRIAGFKVAWEPRAAIVHHGGSSTSQVSRKMFLQLYISKLAFFQIYYGSFRAFLYRLVLIAASTVRLAGMPLAGLFQRRKQLRNAELAGNYRRLIKALLTG